MLLHAAIFLASAITGCGADAMPLPDAASDVGPADGSVEYAVTLPQIPWIAEEDPRSSMACPEGWTATDDPIRTCGAYPAGRPETCDFGEAHFPGEAGCALIGRACPAEDFGDVPSGGAVVYVQSSASGRGDGTRGAPYRSLAEVPWASLAPDTTVALAKGTYAGTATLGPGIRIEGACAAETILSGGAGAGVLNVLRAGAPAVAANLAIRDAPQRGADVRSGGSLELVGVLVEGCTQVGVAATGPGSVVTLRDTAVRETRAIPDGSLGRGVNVDGGASMTASRLLLQGNRDVGLWLSGVGVTASLDDTAVAGTQTDVSMRFGFGVGVVDGASLTARRSTFVDNHGVGILGGGVGVAVTLEDVVVRGTLPRPFDGTIGRGIGVQDGAALSAERLLVEQNHEIGIFVSNTGTQVELVDVVVRDTQPEASLDNGGRGINVQMGATLTATGVIVSQSHEVGLFMDNEGTTATLTDLVVRDTQPRPDEDQLGRGIAVQDGASVVGSRWLLDGNHEWGLFSSGEGATLSVSDVLVRNTLARPERGSFGYGFGAQYGATVDGQRVHIADAQEVGLFSFAGASVTMTDLVVERIARSAAADRGYGFAASAISGQITLSNFHLIDAATCGLMVSPSDEVGLPGEPSLDVSSGVVEGMPIGACVQVDDFDLARVMRDVIYRGNETNLDATELPVPPPGDFVMR